MITVQTAAQTAGVFRFERELVSGRRRECRQHYAEEIDGSGSWRLYERPNGDGDPQLIDEGSMHVRGEEGDGVFILQSSDKY